MTKPSKFESPNTQHQFKPGDIVRWAPTGSIHTLTGVVVRTETEAGGVRGYLDLWLGREKYDRDSDTMLPIIVSYLVQECTYIVTPLPVFIHEEQ